MLKQRRGSVSGVAQSEEGTTHNEGIDSVEIKDWKEKIVPHS